MGNSCCCDGCRVAEAGERHQWSLLGLARFADAFLTCNAGRHIVRIILLHDSQILLIDEESQNFHNLVLDIFLFYGAGSIVSPSDRPRKNMLPDDFKSNDKQSNYIIRLISLSIDFHHEQKSRIAHLVSYCSAYQSV